MPTTRINGIALDLGKMNDLALWTLRSTVVARQHRADRDLEIIDKEIARRAAETQDQLPLDAA